MVVKTKTADADHEQPGDGCTVPPITAHQVAGKNGGRCRFVIVQGVGKYDYFPTEERPEIEVCLTPNSRHSAYVKSRPRRAAAVMALPT